jgi:Icc-related predicted phosphoesterase
MRLFFATDIHGSETCWRKFLNSGPHYDADVVILGGDMTGKALVPIIDDGGGRWHATLLENCDEVRELAADEPRWHALFEEHMLKTVERWMALADEKLHDKGISCFVCPGNDDQLEVDDVIRRAKFVKLAEGEVVDVDGGFQLASTGWANRTPWDTYREEDEPVLAELIKRVTDQLTAAPEKQIFSLHCPPYGTGLDDAPELTAEMDLRNAGHSTIPAGSTAVREAIESLQPALSLHGHIHEARGSTRLGRTLCINPGSSYEQGQLLGAVVDLDGKKKVKRFVLTSG